MKIFEKEVKAVLTPFVSGVLDRLLRIGGLLVLIWGAVWWAL